MKKSISIITAAVLAATALTACSGSKPAQTSAEATESTVADTATQESTGETTAAETPAELKEIVVGASPAPHAEILEAVAPVLEENGYKLVIKEYTDYVQPNLALDAGDLDANYFQHYPYLEQFNEENGTNIVSVAAVHYEPFGIYAGKTATLADIADGAKVAVPNDATNEARALLLLEAQGLIGLTEGAGLNATKVDIAENPKNLNILEVEAAQIPRSLQDVDIAVINGNYAIDAGLKVADALAVEASDSEAATTYGNILAVQEGSENDEAINALVEALSSDEAKTFMETTYNGAVVPLF